MMAAYMQAAQHPVVATVAVGSAASSSSLVRPPRAVAQFLFLLFAVAFLLFVVAVFVLFLLAPRTAAGTMTLLAGEQSSTFDVTLAS